MKLGKAKGYIAKSKLYTKPTWIYKANYKNIGVYKTTKRTGYTHLKNKKGASLVSHKKPGSDLIQLTYKGKNYYASCITVNINYKIKKVRSAFTKIKAKTKQEYKSNGPYVESYYFTNKARANKFKQKLSLYGFVGKKSVEWLY